MPRRLRIHVPGGIYHVTLRGNHQQAVFFADQDRILLNVIVERALQKFEARIHAYCWMTNHLHLVVQTSREPIARPMHNIAAEFARAMQLKLDTSGHFFERRYHATLVDTDTYMLELLRYVHRNPVLAGLASNPGAYRWTSHHNYIGVRSEAWVTTEFALRMFAAERGKAVAAYREFMNAASEQSWEPAQALATGVDVLGDDDFVARMTGCVGRPVRRESLMDLLDEACRRFEVKRDRLASPVRDAYLARVRAWIGYQAGIRGIATLAAVARELGRTEGALRYAIRAYSDDLE